MALWRGEQVVSTAQKGWVLPRTTELKSRVLWRLLAPAHDSAGQLCWCCQPHPPAVHLLWLIQGASGGLAHQRRGWRVQEQVFKGQPGVLHLISSQVQINALWCIILNEPVCAHVSLSPSAYQVSFTHTQRPRCLSVLVWVTWVCGFLIEQQVASVWFWLGRRKAHGVVVCVRRQCTKQRPYLLVVKKKKGKSGCALLLNNNSVDRRMSVFALRALATLSDSTQVEKLRVILQIKRPLKVAHLRGDGGCSLHSLWLYSYELESQGEISRRKFICGRSDAGLRCWSDMREV